VKNAVAFEVVEELDFDEKYQTTPHSMTRIVQMAQTNGKNARQHSMMGGRNRHQTAG
jgi:hypothetical protein